MVSGKDLPADPDRATPAPPVAACSLDDAPASAAESVADRDSTATPGPEHVAVIMDGNGRWAQAKGMQRLDGHRAGVDNIHRIVPSAIDLGIKILTLYAFSTENWGRPQAEVSGLMRLFTLISRRETENLHRQGVRVLHIGSFDGVGEALAGSIQDAVVKTKNNTKMTLNIAFNYGGRAEIVRSVRELLAGGAKAEDITEQSISAHLFTAGQRDPDLIVRTAGEMRLSNFLLWQAAYSEYYASPKCWPDFGPDDLKLAVDSYASRKRKYGRL